MAINYEDIFKRANDFYLKGEYDEALNVLEEVTEKDAKISEFKYKMLTNMAQVCERENDIESLLVCLTEMEKIKPKDENILLKIALNLEQTNYLPNALLYYQKILAVNPKSFDALIHIALLFIKGKKYQSALNYIERAKKEKTNQYITAYAYFKVYEGECKFKEAMTFAKEMVTLDPNRENAYYDCARTSFHLFDYQNTLEYCDKYLKFQPNDTDILCLRIQCLKKLGKTINAAPLYEDLIKRYPNSYVAKRFYAMETLSNKDYQNGMKYYLDVVSPKTIPGERPKVEDKFLEYEKKQWHRENLTNKTILVYHGSFGAGDYLMFSRYIHELETKAGKVLVETNENFYELFKYNFPKSTVIKETKEAIPSNTYDYSCSSMELFYGTNIGFERFPYNEGWLNIPNEKIQAAKNTGIFDKTKLNAGIFWRGSGGEMGYRSMDFENFIPLFNTPNCNFFSFDIIQKETNTLEIMKKYEIKDCSKYIKNAIDTGAFMKNLDVFITVDSFPLHLAGALGIKSYLLLPVLSEWRWFNDNKNTPWYNSVKIFKQTETENIDIIIQKIKKELELLYSYRSFFSAKNH